MIPAKTIVWHFESLHKRFTADMKSIPQHNGLPYPNYVLEFAEWDGPVASRLDVKSKTLTINTRLLAVRKMRYMPFKTIEGIAAWILTREIYWYYKGENHEINLDKLDTPESRDAFTDGYTGKKF